MRGSRRNKIHPRGNPAIVISIPAVFPQHLYPHPRETRGFRRITAVPIPVHTSSVGQRIVGRQEKAFMGGLRGFRLESNPDECKGGSITKTGVHASEMRLMTG